MNKLVLTILGVLSFQSGAAMAKDLPFKLLLKAQAKMQEQCDLANIKDLSIASYEVKEDIIDNGVVDYYFSIVFKAVKESNNEETTSVKSILVKGAEYAISNPAVEKYEVFSVSSPDSRLCE